MLAKEREEGSSGSEAPLFPEGTVGLSFVVFRAFLVAERLSCEWSGLAGVFPTGGEKVGIPMTAPLSCEVHCPPPAAGAIPAIWAEISAATRGSTYRIMRDAFRGFIPEKIVSRRLFGMTSIWEAAVLGAIDS